MRRVPPGSLQRDIRSPLLHILRAIAGLIKDSDPVLSLLLFLHFNHHTRLLKTSVLSLVNMRFTNLLGLAGLVLTQDSPVSTSNTSSLSAPASMSTTTSSSGTTASASTANASSASIISSPVITSPSTAAPSASVKATALTVATDGFADFTAINQAIAAAQNSAIPTVSVLAGTYSESVVIQGTQTVTVAGPTASSYAGNQVVVAAAASAGVFSFNTQKSNGVTFRNINVTNTGTIALAKAPAVNVYGSNMLFDTVALVSSGLGSYTASFGTSLLAHCYVEGARSSLG